jgi:hypothetical protein
MAILSWRELPRTFDRRFGERFAAQRRFVFTVDDSGTTLQTAADTASVGTIGHAHPEFPVRALEFEYEESYEGSRYHSLLTVGYGGDLTPDPDSLVVPTLRPAKWNFQTQGTTVPALFYYDDAGNDSTAPLTNSAFDFFSGVQADEAQCKVVIQENRANFPSALAIDLTNTINSSSWIGGATHCWKCQGINGELKFEFFGEVLYRYWSVTVELLYRQTGWPLQLPDVGFNFLFGSPVTQKRRAVVFDVENAEWVASPGPVGLDGTGGLTLGAPAILVRRVHREVDFNTFFASPPS